MKMLLIEKELCGIVDGTDELAADATVRQRTAYEERARKVCCVLIGDSQAHLVRHLTTAKEVWDTMKDQYQSTSLAMELFP